MSLALATRPERRPRDARDQGRAMGTSAAQSLPADKADAACATMLADSPALLAQRRALEAGDAKAKTDALEKYGLQNMP